MADRSVTVRLRADISEFSRALATASAETQAFGRATDGLNGPLTKTETQSKRTGNEIDKLSGRLRLATDAALILGPALVPLGAAAVGGVIALSAEVGALAGGLGVTLLAVKGLGDGLTALDKYELMPTAENFVKMQQAMKKLGPAGEEFVRFLDSIEPNLKTLQNAAREGLLPGAEEGIRSLMQRLPELRKVIREIATEVGDLASGGGKAIGGPKFDAFFKYLRTDGIKILDDTGKAVGNLAETVANLFVAFGGVSGDFSDGLLKFSQGLADASANLDTNAGFQKFVQYIETEGPHALEALGALADMFLQIVEATAPLGGPVLTALTALSRVIGAIADSDIGTPIFAGLAALALFNRSIQLTQKLNAMTFGGPGAAILKGYRAELGQVITAQDRATMSAKELAAAEAQSNKNLAGLAKAGKGAALIAGLALANSGLAEKTGLSNTASLAMLGTIGGPWGVAIGAGVGLAMDFAAANDGLANSLDAVDAAAASGNLDTYGAALAAARKQLDAMKVGADPNAWDPTGLSELPKIWGKVSGATDDAADRLAVAQSRFDHLSDAARNAGGSADAVVGPFQAMRRATEQNTEAAEQESIALQATVEAMRAKRQEALRAVDAELNYQQAIDDARKSLKENGKTVDDTTDKGRANLRSLYALADGWNQQSDAAKNAKGSLKSARAGFIETAESMGMAEGKAKRLADRLFEIPTKRHTDVGLDGVDNAINKAEGLKKILDQLHSKDINIALHYQTLGNKPSAPLPGASADGTTVPKTGRGYADRHLYLLADGEEVVSNRHGQADRHRGLLKAINAGRMADGGSAGGGGGHSSRPYSLFLSAEGAEITDSAHSIAQALRMLQAALAKSEKSLDKERSARDDLQSQFDSIRSTVGGAYSSMDPFAAAQSTGSVWGSGGNANPLATFDAAVAGNTASTQAAQTALNYAAAHGLDGPLYAALAASGNLPLLQQFAALSAQEIDARELAFAGQSNAQSALGTSAATAEVGTQLAAANKELGGIRDEVKALRRDVKQADINNKAAQAQAAKDIKDGVNGAASNGHRHRRP